MKKNKKKLEKKINRIGLHMAKTGARTHIIHSLLFNKQITISVETINIFPLCFIDILLIIYQSIRFYSLDERLSI